MKRLHLSRETLAELAPDELVLMGGNQPTPPTPVVRTLPLTNCVSPVVGPTITTCIEDTIKCPSRLPTCYCTPMP